MLQDEFINALESDDAPVSGELAAARKALEGIAIKASDDPLYVSRPDIVKALGVLQSKAPIEYSLISARLAACGIGKRTLDREVKLANSNLRAVNSNDGHRPKMLCDIFPNSPLGELIIPSDIQLSEDFTIKSERNPLGMVADLTLAHGAIILTGKTEDIDDGQQGLRISWTEGKGWRHFVVDSATLMDTRAFGALKGYGAPLEITTLRELCSYLLELEARNKNTLPVTKTARTFGWQKNGEEGFLAGRDFITSEGEIIKASVNLHAKEWENDSVIFKANSPGEYQIAEGFHQRGNYGDWINAVTTASKYPVVLATILTSFVPPMLKILGCPNFVFSLDCTTTNGKSIAQMGAASVWGCCAENKGESLFQTWSISEHALEYRSNILSGMPIILDDTEQAPKNRNKGNYISDVIYKVCGGRGSGKGTPGGLRIVKSWETVLISSGEMPIFEMSEEQRGGAKMRVLGIRRQPFGERSIVLKKVVDGLKEAFLENYGFAGVRFVEFITKNKDRWDAWRTEFKTEAERYSKMATTENAGRLATYAAAIAVTARLVHEALQLPFPFYQPLDELWPDISKQAEDTQGAEAAYLFMCNWVRAHQNQFHGQEMDVRLAPSSGWLGRWDRNWDKAAIFPHIVKETLARAGYKDSDKILNEWKERGRIITQKDRPNRLNIPVNVPANSRKASLMVMLVLNDVGKEAEEVD